jgi:hypothetical protein
MPCSGKPLSLLYPDEPPARRIIKRIEASIGHERLLKVAQLLIDESSNNWKIASEFGLKIFEIQTLRQFPFVVANLLTTQKSSEARKSATILPFRQSA